MKSFLKFSHLFLPAILFFVALVLAITNYAPGTFLSGWDALHPEFNFSLNFTRTLNGVFRTEQGLGAVAAHAHMVEIPRIFLLWLLNFIMPLNLLRYAYIFLCLILGPIGMYYFLLKVFLKKPLPSFLGALFYLLNLGTYQTFLVPFEMFPTMFATLPFVFLSQTLLLSKFKLKYLIFFSISILITSISAYASTLWYVFFMFFLIYFTPLVFVRRKKIKGIVKRYMLSIVALLAINTYWLLPNIYFALNEATFVSSANINKLFSEEAFLKNKEFGTWDNILLLKSFYFDWGIYNFKTQGFEQMTQSFLTHLNSLPLQILGWLIAFFMVSGFLVIIKRLKYYSLTFVALLLFCLLFIVNDNFPFSPIFRFMQEKFPLFKEAFRFPDDKIQNVFIFLVTIFFAFSQDFFLSQIKKLPFKKYLPYGFTALISILLLFYMLPAFRGNLIHPYMKVAIPKEYFEVFRDLSKEDPGKVANFPLNSPWGWVYHDWWGDKKPSFQGAGFLYFGVSQSLLERDFDRWNKLNEQYYREISHSVYSKNKDQLKNVIKKYQLSHILVDKSIINPSGDNSSLYFGESFSLLNDLKEEGVIEKETKYGDFLTLYKVKAEAPYPISSSKTAKILKPNGAAYYFDSIFPENGNYISKSSDSLAAFPMSSFITNDSKVEENKISFPDSIIQLLIPKKDYFIAKNEFDLNGTPINVIANLTTLTRTDNLSVSLYPLTPVFGNTPMINPVKNDFTLNKSADISISVNEKVFPVSLLSPENPTILGSTFLKFPQNIISVFENDQIKESYKISDFPFSFIYCNSGNASSDLNAYINSDSIKIEGSREDDFCLNLPLYFIKQKENTTKLLAFSFVENRNFPISVCLANHKTGTCEDFLPIENDGLIKTIKFAIPSQNLPNIQLRLRVSHLKSNSVNLKNISLSSINSSSGTTVTTDSFKSIIPDTFTSVSIPRLIDENYYFVPNEGSPKENECKGISESRKKVEALGGQIVYKYDSGSGSFCDHVPFENLPHSLSYLVFIKSKNKAGLPMNICITNYTSRKCDLYAKLSKWNQPKEDVFFLPATDATGKGYDLNLENTGIKGTPSSNILYSIAFVPIPYELLSQIQIGKVQSKEYTGKVESFREILPSAFLIQTDGAPALVNLNYSYNKGFSLYKISSCTSKTICNLKVLLAPLFGKKVEEHNKGMSWRNTWETDNASYYALIFTPQYLEYAGFAILLAWFPGVILLRKRLKE